jgi:hypothetical protein
MIIRPLLALPLTCLSDARLSSLIATILYFCTLMMFLSVFPLKARAVHESLTSRTAMHIDSDSVSILFPV